MIYLQICMKILHVNPSFPGGQMAGIKDDLEGRLLMQAIASGLSPPLCVFLMRVKNDFSWSYKSGKLQ